MATVTNSAGCIETDSYFEVNVNPLGVFNNTNNLIGLKIFPHPVIDQSTIELTHAYQGNFHLRFYDTSGRLVKQMKLEDGTTELSKSDFNSGMYFYSILDNGQSVD